MIVPSNPCDCGAEKNEDQRSYALEHSVAVLRAGAYSVWARFGQRMAFARERRAEINLKQVNRRLGPSYAIAGEEQKCLERLARLPTPPVIFKDGIRFWQAVSVVTSRPTAFAYAPQGGVRHDTDCN